MDCIGTTLGLSLATVGAFVVFLFSTEQMVPQMFASSSNVPPNNSNISYLDPNGPNVQFVLFTRDNPFYNLQIGESQDLENLGFNFSHQTKIIVHGFTSSIHDEIFTLLRDAYLRKGPYNVIGLDWSVLCDSQYLSALRGVRVAADKLTSFLEWLQSEGVTLDSVHILGHSLGAHVAAIGGDKLTGQKVGRITGLDPAAPGYTDIPENFRLDAGDAQLVDIIHTNINVLSLSDPSGHVDFYPNGGRFQPGCPNIYDIWRLPQSLLCNHGRAYYYMEEAILKKNSFKSKRCETVTDALVGRCNEETSVYMGQAETYKPGIYYFKTKGRKPFSLS